VGRWDQRLLFNPQDLKESRDFMPVGRENIGFNHPESDLAKLPRVAIV
jgi:hypothetical protein